MTRNAGNWSSLRNLAVEKSSTNAEKAPVSIVTAEKVRPFYRVQRRASASVWPYQAADFFYAYAGNPNFFYSYAGNHTQELLRHSPCELRWLVVRHAPVSPVIENLVGATCHLNGITRPQCTSLFCRCTSLFSGVHLYFAEPAGGARMVY